LISEKLNFPPKTAFLKLSMYKKFSSSAPPLDPARDGELVEPLGIVRLRSCLFIFLILSVGLSFGGCKKKEQSQKSAQLEVSPKPGEVIAQVNDVSLTERELEMSFPEAQRNPISPKQKKDYVKRWIENEIIYQEAKKRGIDQEENVKWRIDQAVRNIIIEGFLQKELEVRVKASEEEVKQYYQEHRNEFIRNQDEVKVSHILVKNVAEAGLVAVRIRGGESFGAVAKQMSQDEKTKGRGGDIGYVTLASFPSQFYRAIVNLGRGEISEPIQTEYGFEIITVTDRKEKGSIKEYEQVREEITNILILTKKKKELENLFQELKKEAKVQTFGWASGVVPE